MSWQLTVRLFTNIDEMISKTKSYLVDQNGKTQTLSNENISKISSSFKDQNMGGSSKRAHPQIFFLNIVRYKI